MKWRILSSKYLLKTKWLIVRKDHVKMPSGVEMYDYYVLEYPDWINVIAITEDGKFVIERQYRHGTQSVDYELCAGIIEKGEEPIDAAKRELLEETGFEGGEWSLYCESYPNPAAMTTRRRSPRRRMRRSLRRRRTPRQPRRRTARRRPPTRKRQRSRQRKRRKKPRNDRRLSLHS